MDKYERLKAAVVRAKNKEITEITKTLPPYMAVHVTILRSAVTLEDFKEYQIPVDEAE